MKQLCNLFTVLIFVADLSAQETPTLIVSQGHNQPVTCVDISPNGKFIVSSGLDNVVKIYNLTMQQELNTLVGFPAKIKRVKFSHNNKYIVSLCGESTLLVHSHPEGKLIHTIDLDSDNLAGFFHLTSDGLIVIRGEDYPEAYSIESGKLVKTFHWIENISSFTILPNNNTLVAPITNENEITGLGFYSLLDKKISDFIAMDITLFSGNIQATANGKKIILENKPGEVSIIDVQSKKLEHAIQINPKSVIVTSPNNNELVSAGSDNTVRFWDLNSGKKTREIKDLSPEDVSFSMSSYISSISYNSKGDMIAFAYSDITDGKIKYSIEWFNSKSMKPLGNYSGEQKPASSLMVDRESNMLILGGYGTQLGIKCFDLSKGSQKAFFPGSAYFGYEARNLVLPNYSVKNQPKLDVHQAPWFRKNKSFDLYGSVTSMATSSSGKYLAIIDQKTLFDKNLTLTGIQEYIRVWDIVAGKEVLTKESFLNEADRLIFSENEEDLIVISGQGIKVFPLMDGNSKAEKQYNISFLYSNRVFLANDHKVIGTTREGLQSIDCNTGEITVEKLDFEGFSTFGGAISPDKSLIALSGVKSSAGIAYVHVYDWKTKELVCELTGHSSHVSNLVFDSNNQLYSIDENGLIIIWNIDDCKAKASFLSFNEDDYIITTPEGFYKSSKGNIKNVAFRQRGELYTFDQFDLRFNRPDKVLENLGFASENLIEMYYNAYQKRLKRMGFSDDISTMSFDAPEIVIESVEKLPLEVATSSITISLSGTSANLPLDRLLVSVNDVPIHGKQGLKLKSNTQKTFKQTIEIPLVFGKNTIQVSLMNTAGIESLRKSATIECKKPDSKPDLYILAIGVSQFKDSSMNLTYSHKDAEDFCELFKDKKGKNVLFNNTYVQLFTNENANKESILSAKAKLLESRPNDHVILFFSGHGLLDEQLNYFLSTYDVQFEQPNLRGLNFDDFKDLIDGIPARNRLIFVDACHSGELDKDEVKQPTVLAAQVEEDKTITSKEFAAKGKKIIGVGNTFELMQELFVELRKESGATIIASSAGKEFSLESPIWKNGVFTFAMKEGLIERKADQNMDQFISVSELKTYLFSRVTELTNGKQTPTVRIENSQLDYNIY